SLALGQQPAHDDADESETYDDDERGDLSPAGDVDMALEHEPLGEIQGRCASAVLVPSLEKPRENMPFPRGRSPLPKVSSTRNFSPSRHHRAADCRPPSPYSRSGTASPTPSGHSRRIFAARRPCTACCRERTLRRTFRSRKRTYRGARSSTDPGRCTFAACGCPRRIAGFPASK